MLINNMWTVACGGQAAVQELFQFGKDVKE